MRLTQIAQHVDDLDRAIDFYTVLLDAAPVARFDQGIAFFDLDGVRLMLAESAPSAMLYLAVDNVHDALERLDGLAEVVTKPHVIFTHDSDVLGPLGQDEWQAFVRDSEGNMVALVAFQKP